MGESDIELDTMEEVFTSENWIVRVYKVKGEGVKMAGVLGGRRRQRRMARKKRGAESEESRMEKGAAA